MSGPCNEGPLVISIVSSLARSVSSDHLCGGCLLADNSKNIVPLSLSSAESEYYGAVTTASDGIFVWEVLKFCGFENVKHVLYMDSSAALAMTNRIGVGRVRHIDSRLL